MDSEKMVTQKLRNYAVTAKDGGFKTWAEAMLWAAECIDRKYGTEECEGCADRDEEIDRLKDALRLAADEPNIDKARRIADAALMHNVDVTGPRLRGSGGQEGSASPPCRED